MLKVGPKRRALDEAGVSPGTRVSDLRPGRPVRRPLFEAEHYWDLVTVLTDTTRHEAYSSAVDLRLAYRHRASVAIFHAR